MQDLIKWFVTTRKDIFVYIHREDELDPDTQTVFSEEEGVALITEGSAKEVAYEGSYLESQKLAEILENEVALE